MSSAASMFSMETGHNVNTNASATSRLHSVYYQVCGTFREYMERIEMLFVMNYIRDVMVSIGKVQVVSML